MHRYTMNNKIEFKKNQETVKKKMVSPSDIVSIIHRLPRAVSSLLEELIHRSKKYKNNFVSQELLATGAKINERTVRRVLPVLKNLGLADWVYRGFKKTCLYTVNDCFLDARFQLTLSSVFKKLWYIPPVILALSSSPENGLEKNARLIREYEVIKNRFIKIRSFRSSTYTSKVDDVALKKEGKAMDCLEVDIPSYIREIKFMNLTDHGRIKLTAFPEKIVRYALRQMRISPGIRDIYRYFFGICLKHSRENGIVPNWKLVDQLKAKYNIVDTDPVAISKEHSLVARHSQLSSFKEAHAPSLEVIYQEDAPQKEKRIYAAPSHKPYESEPEKVIDDVDALIEKLKNKLCDTTLSLFTRFQIEENLAEFMKQKNKPFPLPPSRGMMPAWEHGDPLTSLSGSPGSPL